LRRLGGALLLAAAVAVAAGCGTGGPRQGGDAGNGKALFSQKCGACHVMADAGTRGTIGPNLDDAFGPAKEQGFRDSGIQQVVLDQIRIAEPPMPQNLVKGQDAADVSYYVAMCAAKKCNVQAAAPAAAAPTAGSGPSAKGQSLYASLGCQSCHTLDGTKSIGPTFKGLYGSMTALTGGKKVKADDAYLIASIEDPDMQIVMGYKPGVMSAAIKPHSVAQANAKALVAYIKTLK
jgi:cytochrome c oxidase subunit 2